MTGPAHKLAAEPRAVLLPNPVALLVTGTGADAIVMTSAWITPVCETPPVIGISLRKGYSFRNRLEHTGELTLQLLSGADVTLADALIAERSLTEVLKLSGNAYSWPAQVVVPALLDPGKIHLEGRLREKISFEGTHDFYLADVMCTWYDRSILSETGEVDLDLFDYLSFSMGEYRGHAAKIGARSNNTIYRPKET